MGMVLSSRRYSVLAILSVQHGMSLDVSHTSASFNKFVKWIGHTVASSPYMSCSHCLVFTSHLHVPAFPPFLICNHYIYGWYDCSNYTRRLRLEIPSDRSRVGKLGRKRIQRTSYSEHSLQGSWISGISLCKESDACKRLFY